MIAALILLAQGAPSIDVLDRDQRVAVVIGSNIGDERDHALEWAEADAQRFYDVLVDAGGVEKDRAYLVRGGGAQAARRALSEAVGRLQELAKSGPTAFIVYVSAHADEESLHLDGEHLSIAELRTMVQASKATLRLAIIDACRTPVVGRKKGGTPGPDVALAIDRRALVEGDVLITSAGLGEPAQEWTYLRGSLFTHHLIAGLRGVADVDQDGRVSLAEAYAYAFRKTSAESASSNAGAQHPSFDVSMTGWGEWMFTRPERFGASILLADDVKGELLIADRTHSLVAEVVKRDGEELRVAVRPGWYRIVHPNGRSADVADVNLAFGGEQKIDRATFVRVRADRATLRGEDPIVLRPWIVSARYSIATGSVGGLAVQQFGGAAMTREIDDFAIRLRADGSVAHFRGDRQTIAQQEIDVALGAGINLWLPFAKAELAIEGGALFMHQTSTRDDQDQTVRLFGVKEPSRSSAAPFAGPFIAASIPIFETVWANLEIGAALAGVPIEGKGTEARLIGRGALSVAFAF